MIDGHSHDLHSTMGGRLSLVDQYDNLERKYGHAVDRLTKERRDIVMRHKKKRKLIGSDILRSKISNIVKDRYQ